MQNLATMRNCRSTRNVRAGFSLAEVMIALAIFGLMASALVATTVFSRKTAESAVYETTALATAQGYIDQIMSDTITYANLENCIDDPTNYPSVPTMASATVKDSLPNAVATDKVVVLRADDDDNTLQSMTITFDLTLTKVEATGGNELIAVTLDYTWVDPISHKERSGSLKAVKADM